MGNRLKYHCLKPSFSEEKLLETQGYRFIAGIDEVGRGALMGPVMAAAVILPQEIKTRWLDKVKDSKQLSSAVRGLLFEHICETAVSVGIGSSPPRVIDALGIVQATRLAMKSAVEQLVPQPQYLLVDYLQLPEVQIPQKGITYGDSRCFSIACASIVAKVSRDRLMVALDLDYPGYGLAEHKGYGTKKHLASLHIKGPCPIHRRSFRPIRKVI
ncbi:ribonuclease HII [Chloroflexota bacterium]